MGEDLLNLETARKRHHRKRTISHGVWAAVWITLAAVPLISLAAVPPLIEFKPTDLILWYIGLFITREVQLLKWRHERIELTLAIVRDDLAEIRGVPGAGDRLHELLALH